MPDPRPTTRQELYDRIRESSKDEVILDEMIATGFWPEQSDRPDDPVAEVNRIAELQRMLRSLATEASRLGNVEAMKKEAKRRRMAEARARREETKRKREAARRERAARWARRKQHEVLYLGRGVSEPLGQHEGAALHGLPDLQDAAALAGAMGLSVGELRFLAYHRSVSRTTHYVRFQIPKKTGGLRSISAPKPRLKRAQRWVLDELLAKVPIHAAAHGFVPGRSIVTNAAAHVGREVVVNLDLRDFFPTLDYRRVRGLFRSLGYSQEVSTILALVCTEPRVDEVEIDGRRWFVHGSERHLPQGSPCSPAITNLVCWRLDKRLAGLAGSLGFTYTRYADDLTFSGSSQRVGTLLRAVQDIVGQEGFVVHPDKTRVMRRGGRQEVTGLVVNERVGVPRRLLRRWRAVLHQVRSTGPEGKRFGPSADVLGSLQGFAAFVRMVDPDRGDAMLDQARQVAQAHGWSAPRRPVAPPAAAPPASAQPAGAKGESASDDASGEGPEDEPAAKPKWWEVWKWLK